MEAVTGARCARHPEVPAVETCGRCGTFVCGECLELSEQGPLCPSCEAREQEQYRGSPRSIAAVVLGVLGLLCGFWLGVFGLVLSLRELAAIQRGEAPRAGRPLAAAGRILGYLNLAGLVVLLGWLLRLWLTGQLGPTP